MHEICAWVRGVGSLSQAYKNSSVLHLAWPESLQGQVWNEASVPLPLQLLHACCPEALHSQGGMIALSLRR